jgi:hypothetical protein
MKESAKFIGAMRHMSDSSHSFEFQIYRIENTGSTTDVLAFGLGPNPFIRIQLRTIGWQEKDMQASLETHNLICNFFRNVNRMEIQIQKDRLAATDHETIQEVTYNPIVKGSFSKHKTHLPFAIPRTNQIQAQSGSRTPHYRCPPFDPPLRPRMIITQYPRFIPKPNLSLDFPTFRGNRQIFFFQPSSNSYRVLLLGPPKWFLRRNAQLGLQSPRRVATQANFIPRTLS